MTDLQKRSMLEVVRSTNIRQARLDLTAELADIASEQLCRGILEAQTKAIEAGELCSPSEVRYFEGLQLLLKPVQ